MEKQMLQAQQMAAQALSVGNGLNKALSAGEYAAARESAQTIAKSQTQLYEKEARAWRWIDAAMVAHPPTTEEEAALWDLLCRARRERF
jgi:hypothetical protein